MNNPFFGALGGGNHRIKIGIASGLFLVRPYCFQLFDFCFCCPLRNVDRHSGGCQNRKGGNADFTPRNTHN